MQLCFWSSVGIITFILWVVKFSSQNDSAKTNHAGSGNIDEYGMGAVRLKRILAQAHCLCAGTSCA